MSVTAVVEFEQLDYGEGVELQQRLVKLRQRNLIPDVLLLLEHPPVITLGRNAHREHVLADEEQLRGEGVEVAECDRGGDVTYHGPGQLVGYPILDLRACARPSHLQAAISRLRGLGPVDYVRSLEEVLIRTAAGFGLPCRRIAGLTGVWTEGEPARKLAAIGVHVSRGVTSHGFALNVSTRLAAFAAIVPCGIRDRGVTSLQQELGRTLPLAEVRSALLRQFGSVFGRQILRLDNAETLLALEQSASADPAPPVPGTAPETWGPARRTQV